MALIARLGARNRRLGLAALAVVAVLAVALPAAAALASGTTRRAQLLPLATPAAEAQLNGVGWTQRWTAAPRDVLDAGGRTWQADAAVVTGGTVHTAAAGSRVAAQYRYARSGTPAFALPVPGAGTYAVILSFAAPGPAAAPEARVTVALDDGTTPELRLAAGAKGQVRHAVVLVPVTAAVARFGITAASGVGGVSAVTAVLARTGVDALRAEVAEEFDGPAGQPVTQPWRHQTGATGWGNGELQDYTDSPDNSALTGTGALALTARAAGGGYTSARLRSEFEGRYGRIEAVVRVPSGAGLLPAFWMLGADVDRSGWPQAGEVDILESLGDGEPARAPGGGPDAGLVHATVHGPDGTVRGWERTWTARPAGGPAKTFHRYGLDWWPGILQWSVDGVVQASLRAEDLGGKERWVFEQPAFLLLNLAVGGRWPGRPPATTTFPQTMLVDAVHWWR